MMRNHMASGIVDGRTCCIDIIKKNNFMAELKGSHKLAYL
jgi:hypothetical protein